MEQLIYIEQNDKNEASKLSKGFAIEDTKSRAYINALGTELAMKYLAQEDINVSNIYNLHNIHKIREEFDIADVMLPNIHIDVRMVYDENLIFIPKSHFEYGLTPDIYLVFNMSEDASYVKFLGFFEPKLINKNNKNDNYYFIEKEKLSHPSDLKSYIKNFNGNTTESLSEDAIEDAQKLALSLIDNDINDSDKKKLIKMLIKSSSLREEMIEFDNFEWISYHAIANDVFEDTLEEISSEEESAQEIDNVDEFDLFDETDEFETTEDMTDSEIPAEEVEAEDSDIDTLDAMTDDEALDEIIEEENIEELGDELEEDSDTEILEEETQDELQEYDETSKIFDTLLSDEPMEDLPFEEEVLENVAETVSFDNINFDDPVENVSDDEAEYNQETTSFDAIEPLETISDEELPVDEEICAIDDIEPLNEENTEPIEQEEESIASFDELETIEDTVVEEEENTPETLSFEEMEQEEVSTEEEEVEETVSTIESLSEEPVEDFLDTLADESEQSVVSYENSNAITNNDEEFKAGEISIDINQTPDAEKDDEYEKLEVLYNEDNDVLDKVDKNINLKAYAPEKGKKAIFLATAVITAIASLLIYAAIQKSDNKVAEQANTNVLEKNITTPEEQPIPGEVENVIPNVSKPKLEDVAKTAQENVNKPKAPAIESAYIDVKKLGWAVPDYVSYNDSFKKYLQTAGKSLKLTLSSDLLLATEYAYSNQIQVDITLSKEGTIQNAKIAQSSGSTQIDNIVLRTVKETLSVVKAPAGVIVGDNIHLTLKIYL